MGFFNAEGFTLSVEFEFEFVELDWLEVVLLVFRDLVAANITMGIVLFWVWGVLTEVIMGLVAQVEFKEDDVVTGASANAGIMILGIILSSLFFIWLITTSKDHFIHQDSTKDEMNHE